MNNQQKSKLITPSNWIAFGSGLLFSFLTANPIFDFLGPHPSSDASFPPWSAWIHIPFSGPLLIFLLILPLILGFGVPIAIDKLNGLKQDLFFSAFLLCSLGWLGICVYWVPLAMYKNNTWNQEAQEVIDTCIRMRHVGFCSLYLGANVLFIYLLYGIIMIFLSTVITTLIIEHGVSHP